MSDTPPIIKLTPQILTVTALDGYPACLVDDPVYLVDDSRVLVGSPTTPIENRRTNTSSNAPTVNVDIRR